MDLVYGGYDKTILNGINGKVIKNYSLIDKTLHFLMSQIHTMTLFY